MLLLVIVFQLLYFFGRSFVTLCCSSKKDKSTREEDERADLNSPENLVKTTPACIEETKWEYVGHDDRCTGPHSC